MKCVFYPENRWPDVLDEDQKMVLSLQEDPHSSTVSLAQNHAASGRTLGRIFKTEKYSPYDVYLVQELLVDEYDRPMQFCEKMMRRCDENNGFPLNKFFLDEATLYSNGVVNRHNYRFCRQKNLYWISEAHTQHHQKVNLLAGIINNRILGPYLFDENFTAERYLDFLRLQLVPALTVKFSNEVDRDILIETIWFQQDGAPPHFGINVREYLDEIIAGRWIGRGTIEWPPRYPDLMSLDYFLWGYLKDKVYQNRPDKIKDLINKIRVESNNVPAEAII